MAVRIQWRRDTAANWTSYNPILADGEMGLETDTRKFKIGNGVDNWSTLLYMTIGLSAYEVAVANGFVGTESAWLASLVGATGATGPAGADGADGIDGTNGVDGTDGLSAYEVAVANGFTGTITDWLTSLVGATGPAGADGADGVTGPAGVVAATAPVTYDSLTQTVGIDQSGFDHIASLNYASFDLTPTGVPTTAGTLSWNDVDGTLDLRLNGVTLQVGQEQVIKVQKFDNSGLLNGKVVYINGSNGDNKLVDYALATGDATSAETFGVMTETVSGGAKGFATTFGMVRDIDTSTLTEGATVYLSGTVAGGMTTTKPVAPTHLVQIGYCVRSHATTGMLFVKIQNGYELAELHDVDLTTVAPTDGQVIAYEAASGLFKPATISGGAGGYPTISTAVKTTASIATGATETGTITIAQGYRLLKIETDKAARVRLYTTTAGRDADVSRPFGVVEPDINNGVMFDFQTTGTNLSDDVNPQVDGYVYSGTSIPITITNLNGSTGTVTVTLTYVRTI